MKGASQYCTFYLDELYLGVEVTAVQEVLRHQVMTRVPLASGEVRGLINLRGEIVTAVDLRQHFRLPEYEGEPMNVVLRSDEGAIALLVDAIGDVIDVGESDYEPTPSTLDARFSDLVSGVYKLADRQLMLVLKTDAVQAASHSI